jgi:hypothetical protein
MRQSRSQSISGRVGCICAVAIISSCAGNARAPARSEGADEHAPAARTTASAPPASLAEISARCESLQHSAQIPVTCHTELVDDAPWIVVGFRDLDEANSWLVPVEQQIGAPFCVAASRSRRPGRVYMAVGSAERGRGRRFSCELGQWGEWFPLSAHTEAMRPTLRDVVATCRRVQDDQDLPITCAVDELGGLATIIVGFGTEEDTEQHLGAIVQEVGGPFCDAANLAGRRAVFIVTVGNAHARPFDCAGQRWLEWFSLTLPAELPRGTLQ